MACKVARRSLCGIAFIPSCENFVEMLDKYREVCYNIKYDNRRFASFNREKRIHKRVGVFLQKW